MSGGTPDKAGPDPAPDTTPVIRQATYGRNFSYFSHRIFVTYFPEELHDYLGLLFTLKPEAADSTAVTTQQNDTDEIEIELVRWVLLHRSQLNPLALNRLIEAWRGPNQELRIPVAGGVRSDHECRVDITIQFALELELAAAREHWLLQTRPRLQMALLDAAYFVTRQWMEFNRPEREGQPADFGEPGRDDDHPVLDLSSQDVFRGYLVHRMNLLEDKDQKQGPPAGTGSTDGDKHDVPAEPSPLNEPEFKWLFSIVLGIANTLSTATSKDEVKRRWLQVEKSRRSTLPPATALYDALLTEDNKTVLIESEDGSLRYRWRPPPDRGLASSDPREIAALTRNARRRIAFVADTLRRAMTSADGTPPAVHPLRTLADRYHVLPTTPAWERVETALSDLRAAQEQGLGNPQALASDDDVVRQYDALLASERAASVVVHMLVMGAALAGMVPRGTGGPAIPRDRPDGAAWELALQAIGDALLLDSSTLAVTERSLLQAYADLGKLLPLPPYPRTAGGTGVWPSRPQLEAALAAAFAAGQQSQHDLASEATLADAGWRALQTRLSAVAQDAAAAPLAQAVEMVCLVRAIGPGASLPQRLDRTGYRFWTKLLITALKPAGWLRPSTKAPELPAPVIAHIAERLGIRAWGSAAQEAWIESLPLSKERREALRNYIVQEGLWRGTPRAAASSSASGASSGGRLALVLGPAGDAPSVTEGWPQPPQGGLVLAGTAQELDDLQAIGLDRWMQALQPPLVVAWEPGMETSTEHMALRKSVNKLASGMGLVEVWLYRASQAGTQTPRRIDPATAEELWVDFSAPS